MHPPASVFPPSAKRKFSIIDHLPSVIKKFPFRKQGQMLGAHIGPFTDVWRNCLSLVASGCAHHVPVTAGEAAALLMLDEAAGSAQWQNSSLGEEEEGTAEARHACDL